MSEKTATLVHRLKGWTGDARLYRLSPGIRWGTYFDEERNVQVADHVVVSATAAYSEPETYIFAADADGNVLDWGELPGSFRGGLDHEQALFGAGYEVAS